VTDDVSYTDALHAPSEAAESPPTEHELLTAALAYARVGYPVVALHDVQRGHCSCQGRAPHCKPGKHPRYHPADLAHGPNCATTHEETIRRWWWRWPLANIALRMGTEIEPGWSVVALDIDGELGEHHLRALQSVHGDLPPTAMSRTGSGGRHMLWLVPADARISNSQSALDPSSVPDPVVDPKSGGMVGLDVKSTGGMVVVAPSWHEAGRQYKWIGEDHPARAPDWLIDLMISRGGAARAGHSPQHAMVSGASADDLVDAALEAAPFGRHRASLELAHRVAVLELRVGPERRELPSAGGMSAFMEAAALDFAERVNIVQPFDQHGLFDPYAERAVFKDFEDACAMRDALLPSAVDVLARARAIGIRGRQLMALEELCTLALDVRSPDYPVTTNVRHLGDSIGCTSKVANRHVGLLAETGLIDVREVGREGRHVWLRPRLARAHTHAHTHERGDLDELEEEEVVEAPSFDHLSLVWSLGARRVRSHPAFRQGGLGDVGYDVVRELAVAPAGLTPSELVAATGWGRDAVRRTTARLLRFEIVNSEDDRFVVIGSDEIEEALDDCAHQCGTDIAATKQRARHEAERAARQKQREAWES